MNYALILAGGTGQRMRTSGMPKQFLQVYGKPIIIYTLLKFDTCSDIDAIVVACNPLYVDYLSNLITQYPFTKKIRVISGGKDRQNSIKNGITLISDCCDDKNSIVVIHDGVRPLIEQDIISENIRIASKEGCAMTVKPVIESVVVSDTDSASFSDFKKRDDTYSLTSPQTFKLSILQELYDEIENSSSPIPILDAAIAYTYGGKCIPLVKEYNHNIKITTAEDYYILKALIDLQESKNVFGLN